MSTQTVEQVQRLAPYLEGLEQRLLGTAFGEFDGKTQTSPGLLDTALALPNQQVAGLDPLQQQAFSMAPGMVGSYAPFVQGASGQTLGGQAALNAGLGLLANPAAAVQKYANPYQSYVLDEINRQAAIGRQKRNASAVQAGAFGGSRQGIQEAEAEGRRLAAIGQAQGKGFSDAMTQSQRAAQLMGGLGQAYGGLASTTADIGRVQSELGRADLGIKYKLLKSHLQEWKLVRTFLKAFLARGYLRHLNLLPLQLLIHSWLELVHTLRFKVLSLLAQVHRRA